MTQLSIPDLAGKAVLVTGASTGIGAALAKALGAQGAMVGVHYNSSKDAAEIVATAVREAGGRAFMVRADASKSAEIARAVEDTAGAFGRLDGGEHGSELRRQGPARGIGESYGVDLCRQVALAERAGRGGALLVDDGDLRRRFGGGGLREFDLLAARQGGLCRGGLGKRDSDQRLQGHTGPCSKNVGLHERPPDAKQSYRTLTSPCLRVLP